MDTLRASQSLVDGGPLVLRVYHRADLADGAQPGGSGPLSPKADGMKHLWTLWWMRASVWREEFPFSTQLVNWPEGMDLYPIEPLNGLVSIATPFLSIILLSNLLVMVNLFATGMVGSWFGRLLTGDIVSRPRGRYRLADLERDDLLRERGRRRADPLVVATARPGPAAQGDG